MKDQEQQKPHNPADEQKNQTTLNKGWDGLDELVRDMTLVSPAPMAKSEIR